MGKIKSAIVLALMAALIVVLCFFSTVSFPYGDGFSYFNSAVSMTAKDPTLGGSVGGGDYYGGGYSAVYYPEGVISSAEYENDKAVLEGEDLAEYEGKYVAYGALYLDKEEVCGGGTAPTEAFKASFDSAVASLKARYSAFHAEGIRLDVADEYTVRVFLPQALVGQAPGDDLTANGGTFSDIFNALSYTGEFTVSYGSDEASATQILPEPNKRDAKIQDYVKRAYLRTDAAGTAYVAISFTQAGRAVIAEKTTGSDQTAATMYFKVGDDQVIALSVNAQIDQSTLYISGGNLTGKTAETRAILINDALKAPVSEISFTVDDIYTHEASFGNDALLFLYIAFGVCFVGMMIFFFARYGKLGFAHLFSFLLFFFSMLLCIWAIPFLNIGVGTVVAMLLASVILSVSNVISYESARKDYALGKTIVSSVKAGYKRTFWHVFDLHIVVAALSFIMYGIGIAGLSTFAFVLGLATAFSAVATMAINRLAWAAMMTFTERKGAFCRFRREEVEDD